MGKFVARFRGGFSRKSLTRRPIAVCSVLSAGNGNSARSVVNQHLAIQHPIQTLRQAILPMLVLRAATVLQSVQQRGAGCVRSEAQRTLTRDFATNAMQGGTSLLGYFARWGTSHAEWTPVHSSSCGVLFRLCETLCVDTDHFAIPRTLGLRAHSRVSNLDFRGNALPPYHARQEQRCDLEKNDEVSLSHQVES